MLISTTTLDIPCNCVMTKSLTKWAALSSPEESSNAPTTALNVLARMKLSTGYS